MSKEDIEHFDCPGCGWLISIPDYAEEYINQEKKQEAIMFFVWVVKTAQKIDTHIEKLYELYQQSKEQKEKQ